MVSIHMLLLGFIIKPCVLSFNLGGLMPLGPVWEHEFKETMKVRCHRPILGVVRKHYDQPRGARPANLNKPTLRQA